MQSELAPFSSLSQSHTFKQQIPNYVRMRRRHKRSKKKLNQNKYAINVYNRLNMRAVRYTKRRLAANGGKNDDRPLHKQKFSQTLALVLLFRRTPFVPASFLFLSFHSASPFVPAAHFLFSSASSFLISSSVFHYSNLHLTSSLLSISQTLSAL